ncbi:hypothetical protein CTAYLR_002124 [Chrysophaeum taylorii]|uniref:Uncharacterized protein n=1 Tax=Chrysophaeum taylorii TaxID=2483200 RepID=A0AAD7XPW4_9STRA|nr:hypothetical protein CTAYLR_002124 [Chrysophaeum taylorii]
MNTRELGTEGEPVAYQKLALLAGLVVQNAALNVAARRARVVASVQTQCPFQSTTGVVVIELLKIVGAILLLRLENSSFVEAAQRVAKVTTSNPVDCAKILVPAFLYTISNNLLLVAADNLEGPLLALFGQLKILATGVFTVTLLRRWLVFRQWLALVVLTAAIAVVQIAKRQHSTGDEGAKNIELGLFVVTLACFISGFAGVYFESVLKANPISLWIRNIHLATFSCLTGSFVVLAHTESRVSVAECGVLAGFGKEAWLYVGVQACGGLLIGAVIKYADNILKTFATAVSLLIVAFISNIFYSFVLSKLFFAGAAGVIYALFLYADVLRHIPICSALPTPCGGNHNRSFHCCNTNILLHDGDVAIGPESP